MLRRRLTIVFMLAVGLSAAALAAGSYFVVRHNLLNDSVDSGSRQTRRNLAVAPTYLRQGPKALLDAYERRGDFLTVEVNRGREYSSSFLGALVGAFVARRTLRPVAQASTAARSLAEGLLETRLPVEGSDEFGAWAQAFNEMAAALEAKISALSEAQARERRFTADVAHELRTPLTALVGEASLLADHLDAMPAASRRPAELLIADVGRLRRLVEDLMEISRFDAGRESVQAENVDLGSLAAAAIRSRGWEGHVRLDAEEVVITSDPRRLERIVANLVGNALDHGGHGVAVRVGRDGTGAFVEVADRGPGIPREHLPHLFERFYKADASRSSRGTGLGLAIAQENARLLGGEIDVWSEPGEGSRFTLRLPSSVVVTEPLRTSDFGVSQREEHSVHQERRRSP